MDSIWNCAFGIDIDLQNNPNNEYFFQCERAFSNTVNLTFPLKLGGNIKYNYEYEIKNHLHDFIFKFTFTSSKSKSQRRRYYLTRSNTCYLKQKMYNQWFGYEKE
jgi:hypothetical protein